MNTPMRLPVLISILSVLSVVHAQEPEQKSSQARRLLEKAIKAQGSLAPNQIVDLQVKFEGQIQEKGTTTQSITRKYWFRSADRSFRIRTIAGLDPSKPYSERGVKGGKPERFWEWARKQRTPLKLTNREHVKNIAAIKRDRDAFERIVRTVLLARLLDKNTTVKFAPKNKVLLPDDFPADARRIFPDRTVRYHVVDVTRPGNARLRFFIHERDFTVRKVVQFDARRPDAVKTISYFGAFTKLPASAGLTVPRAISVYSHVPTDEQTRKKFVRISGRLGVMVNQKLTDDVFAP